MINCPHCQSAKCQHKAGFTQFRSQRYCCGACQRTYTPTPKPQGHPATLRQQAVRYALEGLSQRKVARLLGVAPQSVANWLTQAGNQLQALEVPEVPAELGALADEVMEQDEVYTFCQAKHAQPNPPLKFSGAKKPKTHSRSALHRHPR